MAVTPEEAAGDKAARRAERANQLEAHFDQQLRERYDGSRNLTISILDGCGDVVDEVRARFEAKGWLTRNWTAGGTQQGEMSVCFTAAPPPMVEVDGL